MRGDLERDRIDELAGLAGLIAGEPEEFGLGLDRLGAIVVNPSEHLIQLRFLIIAARLQGEYRDVIARRFRSRRLRRGGGRCHGRAWCWRARGSDHHDFGFEIAKTKPIHIGEAAIGVNVQFRSDDRRRHDPLADLL